MLVLTLSRFAGQTSGYSERGDDVDEYEDEDDLGYVREYIRGQAAFRARELIFEDDSSDAMRLYHQARASQEGQHVCPLKCPTI